PNDSPHPLTPWSVSTRTSRMSMLVTARSRSRGVAPSMIIGSVTTRVSTRVIFMARVCYTAAPPTTSPPPSSASSRPAAAPARRNGCGRRPAPDSEHLTVLALLAVHVPIGFSHGRERAIRRRRTSGMAMEHHREMAAGAKAHRARDRVDREIAPDQERARALDAPLHHEAVRRHPRALFAE